VTSWAVEPHLRDPVLVCAFEGWNDAANAATDALRFMIRQLNATDIGGVDAEDYFDFQAARPHVEMENGVVKKVRWPNTRFALARVARAERDLVLVLGVEPNLRWPAFCREILTMAADLGCSLTVTLGALLGDAPHSRPVRVTGTADPELAQRLGLQRSRYEGPTGIVGVLTDASRRIGLPTVSLWAPVPHYVATPPSPMATHSLLDRLTQLTGIPLPLQSLEVAGRGWQQHVTAAIDDESIREYVADLEARYDRDDPADLTDASPDPGLDALAEEEIDFEDWSDWEHDDDDWEDFDDPAAEDDDEFDEDDLPSGDAIARELEKFLRENRDDNPDP
jgi:proteasome assembly chaperone (PAC2) family protein